MRLQGELHYFWRALNQDGHTFDILAQKRPNKAATRRFFGELLKHQQQPSWRLITDKLQSHSAAHQELLPSVTHSTGQYENNQARISHA